MVEFGDVRGKVMGGIFNPPSMAIVILCKPQIWIWDGMFTMPKFGRVWGGILGTRTLSWAYPSLLPDLRGEVKDVPGPVGDDVSEAEKLLASRLHGFSFFSVCFLTGVAIDILRGRERLCCGGIFSSAGSPRIAVFS